MVRRLLFLLAIAAPGASAPGKAPPASPPLTAKEIAQGYRDGFILAKPTAAHRATVDAAESAEGWTTSIRFARFGELRVLKLAAGDTPDSATRRLRATGRYEYVEPDYIKHAAIAPADPDFAQQWGLNNTGSNPNISGPGLAGADIRAEAAWNIRTSAAAVVVGVLDSGALTTHQDLASNLWVNPSPGQTLTYAVGGRGYTVTDSACGLNAVARSGLPTDDNGHGTHVSGIIGAVPNNGIGVAGVAWNVQLMELKFLDSSGSGDTTDELICLDYAIAHGVSIINGSFGDSAYSAAEATAIQQLGAAGIILVVAAGNTAEDNGLTLSYPANYPFDNIVTVACSDNRDDSVYFTSYGSGSVDLYAPGNQILSLSNSGPTATATHSGTSMSTPFVTGALALLKAQFPGDTYRQLINRLLNSVDRSADFAGKAQTGGRLNLAAALASTSNGPFNDNFASRAHLAGTSVTVRSNNTGATREPGEPAIAGNAGGASLWWDWTAPASGSVTVTAAGRSFTSLVGVYTGTSLGALVPVAGAQGSVTFTARAGTTYAITVDGLNGGAGQVQMSLAFGNTSFGAPIILAGASATVNGSNIAKANLGLLSHSFDYLVWYSWTAPKTGQFQISVSSYDFDPRLAVYTGATQPTLTQVARSTGNAINTNASAAASQCTCTFNATAGMTYTLTVDGTGDHNAVTDAGPLDAGGGAVGGGQFTLSIADSRWQAATDDSVTCAPAVGADGTVYVGSDNGTFYAFNPDGTTKWTYATGPAYITTGSFDTSSAAISADGATVYAGCGDGYVYAFNAVTGSLRWRYAVAVATSPPACSPAIGADGTIYIRDSGGSLYALGANGTLRWIFPVPGLSYAAPAIASDGTVYIGADDGNLYAITPGASSATQKWAFSTNTPSVPNNAIYTAPAIDGAGNLYFGTLGGMFYAVTSTGSLLWSFQAGNSISSSPALGPGGAVYFGSYDHKIYALGTSNGALQWTYPAGDEIRASSPVIDGNGVVYVGCYDSRIYAINPAGTLNRIIGVGDWVRSSPAIFGTTLYFGSNDHKLTAVDIGAGSSGSAWPMYLFNSRRIGRAIADLLAITAQPAATVSVTPGSPFALTAAAVGQGPLTFQWYLNGAPIPGAVNSTYGVASAGAGDAGSYAVAVTGPQGTVTSSPSAVSIVTPPAIAAQPQNESVNAGATAVLAVGATGGALSYQWYFNGTAVSGATTATLTLANVGTTQAGSYSVIVSNSAGSTSAAATLAVTSSALLTNLSARAFVGTGAQILVAGFVVSGSSSKQLLIRGVGPALSQYAVSGALLNPQLSLYDSTPATIATDAGWGNAVIRGPSAVPASVQAGTSALFAQVYAFPLPAGSADCAMLAVLPAGSYTAQVGGIGSTTGIALAELYDADGGTPATRAVNLSARSYVGAGVQALVAGFAISGSTSETVLIRGVGPALSQYGVAGPLASPQLTLFDGGGAVIATNAGWSNSPIRGPSNATAGLQPATPATYARVLAYALPSGSADCAMVATLPPGAYTAQVSGLGGATGVALAEVYEVR